MKSPHLTAQIRHNVVNNQQCTSVDNCSPYGNPSLSDALAFNYHGAIIEVWRDKVYVQKVRSVDLERANANYLAIDPYRFPGFQHKFVNGLHYIRVVEEIIDGKAYPVVNPGFAGVFYNKNGSAALVQPVPATSTYPTTTVFSSPGNAFCPSNVDSPTTPPTIIQPGGNYKEVFYAEINGPGFTWNINVGPWWQSSGLCNDPLRGSISVNVDGPLSYPYAVVNGNWHNLQAVLHFVVVKTDDAFSSDSDNQLVNTGAGGVVPWTTVRDRSMGFINKYPNQVPNFSIDPQKQAQAEQYCQSLGLQLQTDQGRGCVTDVALGVIPSDNVATFLQHQFQLTLDSTQSAKMRFLATLISNLITNIAVRKDKADLSAAELKRLQDSQDKLQVLYDRLDDDWKASTNDFDDAGNQLVLLDADLLAQVKGEIQKQVDAAKQEPDSDAIRKTISLLTYMQAQFNLAQ
jgi:hypothetical protein